MPNDLVSTESSRGPARPSQLTVKLHEEFDQILLRRRCGGPWAFMLWWLIGWTVGCIWFLFEFMQDPAFVTFVGGLAFWVTWFVVAAALLWFALGTERLTIGPHEATLARFALIPISYRAVPRHELLSFRECRGRHKEDNQQLLGIELVTPDRPIPLAFRLSDGERTWLLHQLNQFLERTSPVNTPWITTAPAGDALTDSNRVAVEALTNGQTQGTALAESSWRLEEGSGTFTFNKRGRWYLQAKFWWVYLFIVVWNCAASGAMLGSIIPRPGLFPNLNEQGRLGVFACALDLEVLGLLMLLGLVVALLEPLRRTTWRFESDRIVNLTGWLLYRRTQSWKVGDLDRLELRRHYFADPSQLRYVEVVSPAQPDVFSLALVDSNNVDLCTINRLTEPEARWMAQVIHEQRRNWFIS